MIYSQDVFPICCFILILAINSVGDFAKYFTTNLTSSILTISTSREFLNYEFEQKSTTPAFSITFTCFTGSISVLISFTIEEANNYDPEFTKTTYEVTVPTPLPTGLDITYFMTDGGVSALDYDLYANSLSFEMSGSNLFRVVPIVDESGIKPNYKLRIFTTQNILNIDGDEITISLTATVRKKI